MDRGIQNVVNQINDFYKDNKTAYVFTSDHGMTDWGEFYIDSIINVLHIFSHYLYFKMSSVDLSKTVVVVKSCKVLTEALEIGN